MSCGESCNAKETVAKPCLKNNATSSVIILVLYILLAIIIGTCLFN